MLFTLCSTTYNKSAWTLFVAKKKKKKKKRWQGPPNINKLKQYETVLSFKVSLFIQFMQSRKWRERVYQVCLHVKISQWEPFSWFKKTKFIRREKIFSRAVLNSFWRIWSLSENFLLIFSTQYTFLELVVIIYPYTLLSVTVIVSLMSDKHRGHQPSIPFLLQKPQKSTWLPSRMVFCFWVLFSVFISSKQARLLCVKTKKLHSQDKVLFNIKKKKKRRRKQTQKNKAFEHEFGRWLPWQH